MSCFDALASAVEGMTSVVASAIALIDGIAERLRNAQTDPAEVARLADELNAAKDLLAAAVAANTDLPAAESESAGPVLQTVVYDSAEMADDMLES